MGRMKLWSKRMKGKRKRRMKKRGRRSTRRTTTQHKNEKSKLRVRRRTIRRKVPQRTNWEQILILRTTLNIVCSQASDLGIINSACK